MRNTHGQLVATVSAVLTVGSWKVGAMVVW
jgi:hypothetical protein